MNLQEKAELGTLLCPHIESLGLWRAQGFGGLRVEGLGGSWRLGFVRGRGGFRGDGV